MSTHFKKAASTAGNKLKTVKINSDIFSKAVAISQNRDLSLPKLFSFEMHSFPPSISDYGGLYLPGTKATLIKEIVGTCHDIPNVIAEYDSKSSLIMDGGRLPYQFTPKTDVTYLQMILFLVLNISFLFDKTFVSENTWLSYIKAEQLHLPLILLQGQ